MSQQCNLSTCSALTFNSRRHDVTTVEHNVDQSWRLSICDVARQRIKADNVFIGKYLHLPVTALRWSIIEQLSLFADEDNARLKVRCLATSRIHTRHDWSTLFLIDVTSWWRLLNVMAEHTPIATLLWHVFRLIHVESSRKTLKNNLKMKCKYKNWKFTFQPLWCDEDSGRR